MKHLPKILRRGKKMLYYSSMGNNRIAHMDLDELVVLLREGGTPRSEALDELRFRARRGMDRVFSGTKTFHN